MKKGIIISVVTLVLACLNYLPLELAIKKIPNDRQDYILVKQQKVTGFDWYIIGDHTGIFDIQPDIILNGAVPKYEVPSGIFHGDNTFICFGEYEADIYVYSQLSKVFKVDSWSIVYPIKRDGLLPSFLNPKYGTNIWDYIV